MGVSRAVERDIRRGVGFQAAERLIDEFARGKGRGAFSAIPRDVVAEGLRKRILHPDDVDAGETNLCSPAALFFAFARDRPDAYVRLVVGLYERGSASFGKWLLKPSANLLRYVPPRDSDYYYCHPADWIPMASLRNHSNWAREYASIKNDGGSSVGELAKWFGYAGYREVINEASDVLCQSEANLRKASSLVMQDYHVCLALNLHLLYPRIEKKDYRHTAVLMSTVLFHKDTISFRIYSDGHVFNVPQEGNPELKLQDFLDHYYGFVACRY